MDSPFADALREAIASADTFTAKLRVAMNAAPSAGAENVLADLVGRNTNGLQLILEGEERRLAQMAEVAAEKTGDA